MALIHSSYYQPRSYPYEGTIAPAQIDRVQDLTAAVTLNRERIREVGRDGTVDWLKRIPTCRVTMRQLEYGTLAFWQQLANDSTIGGPGQTPINIATDFKTSMVDICGYRTDDDGTFIGTVWYPQLRTAGWGINIGDPQAIIERNFDLIGEDEILLESNNKYFIYKTFTSAGSGSQNFVVSNPIPAGDPDSSGNYLFRVVRYRGTTTTTLTLTTDYTYTAATNTLTILSAAVGDVIKVYYSAGSYIGGSSVFTNNDSDAGGLMADSATIRIAVGEVLYTLQSVAIDVTYDRTDYYEIGNSSIISRGARDKTVRITLGRVVSTQALEEYLRGVGSTFGKINPRNFLDNITLQVLFYTTNTKGTFAIGYEFSNLSPVGIDAGTPLYDNITRGITLEGEAGIISTDSNQFTI